MDWNQALSAAAKHFQAAPSDFKHGPKSNENNFLSMITGLRLPSYFTYEKDGIRLTVYFVARVPADGERPLAVEQIRYEVPWSKANSAEMEKAALAKYGEQSNAPNTLPMEWCARPSYNPGMGCDTDNRAVLKLTQTELTLHDLAWRDGQQAFIDELKTLLSG